MHVEIEVKEVLLKHNPKTLSSLTVISILCSCSFRCFHYVYQKGRTGWKSGLIITKSPKSEWTPLAGRLLVKTYSIVYNSRQAEASLP